MGIDHTTRRRPDLHGGAETILVVDDEWQVRKLVRAVLQRKGHTILEAANGADALQICGKYPGPIHLLLTDVVMPGMNGPELARQAIALRPGLPVLFMSGDTDPAVLGAADPRSGAPFVQKPFGPTELIEKVGTVLRSGPAED